MSSDLRKSGGTLSSPNSNPPVAPWAFRSSETSTSSQDRSAQSSSGTAPSAEANATSLPRHQPGLFFLAFNPIPHSTALGIQNQKTASLLTGLGIVPNNFSPSVKPLPVWIRGLPLLYPSPLDSARGEHKSHCAPSRPDRDRDGKEADRLDSEKVFWVVRPVVSKPAKAATKEVTAGERQQSHDRAKAKVHAGAR